MGRLRACCFVLILASTAIAFKLYASGAPTISSIAILVGVAILTIITPIPAYNRPMRNWVFRACAAYVAASALGFLTAISVTPNLVTASSAILPLTGSLLTLWAYRTRKRKRISSLSQYFDE